MAFKNYECKFKLTINAELVRPSTSQAPGNIPYTITTATASAIVIDRPKPPAPKTYDNKLVIYVDTVNLPIGPASFNQSAIMQKMQEAVDAVNLDIKIELISKSYSTVTQSTLGFKDTVPGTSNPGMDLFSGTLKFESVPGSGAALNSDGKNVRIDKLHYDNLYTLTPGATNNDLIYANILLHEFFWHGVLGYAGHSGDDGTFGSTNAGYLSLVDLSSYASQIRAKFN